MKKMAFWLRPWLRLWKILCKDLEGARMEAVVDEMEGQKNPQLIWQQAAVPRSTTSKSLATPVSQSSSVGVPVMLCFVLSLPKKRLWVLGAKSLRRRYRYLETDTKSLGDQHRVKEPVHKALFLLKIASL